MPFASGYVISLQKKIAEQHAEIEHLRGVIAGPIIKEIRGPEEFKFELNFKESKP